MFIDGKLIDEAPLSKFMLNNEQERSLYIQGAIHELLEKWDDVITDQGIESKFYFTDTFFPSSDTF